MHLKIQQVLFLSGLVILMSCSDSFELGEAKINSLTTIEVKIGGDIAAAKEKVRLRPAVPVKQLELRDSSLVLKLASPLRLDTHYYVEAGSGKSFAQPAAVLDSLYSDKPLGCVREDGGLQFRVFAPRARRLRLVRFDRHTDQSGREFDMKRDKDGVWEFFSSEDWTGKYYGYRVDGPQGNGELFDSTLIIADPYSQAVASQNHYTHPARTLILPVDDFDWEEDTWLNIPERDLQIYEMHVRDMTAHPSSQLDEAMRGTYAGLISEKQRGGLPYIRRLGVNAVELLPIHDFGNIEVPFKDAGAPVFNTWNPYAHNHWGYMSSYFFAPESWYATSGTREPGEWNGSDGRQVREFKQLVKQFHRNNIAVILDVVYNHVSEYDYNPFKYLDKYYYFRLDGAGNFLSISGCGNDFKTERRMARRMIVESVLFWMREYHVDGFRFDLAKMIDWETCEEIIREARKLNPNVIIIAEPWGGGYDPSGFSDRGWASWNDQIRNGFKGWDPENDRGFIFGEWQGENTPERLQRYIMGSLRQHGGQYLTVDHSVNYLEAHDNHTLGDFIRIATGEVAAHSPVKDVAENARLSPRQLKLNKLAALLLFSSQGPLMLHEGQEYARSKIIAPTSLPDSAVGRIDHNSYEKDNETNWLNFEHAAQNEELLSYYRKLIRLRKNYDALRLARPGQISFGNSSDKLLLLFQIDYPDQKLLVAANGNTSEAHAIELPAGKWTVLADAHDVYPDRSGAVLEKELTLPPSSGIILKKL